MWLWEPLVYKGFFASQSFHWLASPRWNESVTSVSFFWSYLLELTRISIDFKCKKLHQTYRATGLFVKQLLYKHIRSMQKCDIVPTLPIVLLDKSPFHPSHSSHSHQVVVNELNPNASMNQLWLRAWYGLATYLHTCDTSDIDKYPKLKDSGLNWLFVILFYISFFPSLWLFSITSMEIKFCK